MATYQVAPVNEGFNAPETLTTLHFLQKPDGELNEHLADLQKPFVAVIATVVLALTILGGISWSRKPTGNSKFRAPVVGLQTSWIARVLFLKDAKDRIHEGYTKYRDSVYKLSGNDMLILPAKHVDELRNLPEDEVNSIKANTDNFQGVYSATSILTESDLHTRVLQRNLTPKLAPLIPVLRHEIDYAFSQEMPDCDDWTDIPAFKLLIHVISRTSSRLFIGEHICRDMAWLNASRGYTDSAFKAIILLRIFPAWLKPVVAPFIPFTWAVKYHLHNAKKVLLPLIAERRAAKAAGSLERDLKFDNLLQFMDDDATGIDKRPDKLAGRALILTLASSHTTSMAACQALFQLCEHPEYIPELREEIRCAVQQDGGWAKTTLTRLRKLDSFVKESQRVHPPSLLGFKRAFLKPRTLADGTFIPAGAHTLMAISPHQQDDPRIHDPDHFDGLRYYRMRQEVGQSNKHQFATTDAYTLHFGHGKFSCPGRFLASNVIKLILAQLLLEYDFRLVPGSGRPADYHAHEYVFPSPFASIQFKRRHEDVNEFVICNRSEGRPRVG